jgi:hypothetical protein
MLNFNLSAIAVRERAVTLFFILLMFADTLLDFARGFVGDPGCFVSISTHDESFHRACMTRPINLG